MQTVLRTPAIVSGVTIKSKGKAYAEIKLTISLADREELATTMTKLLNKDVAVQLLHDDNQMDMFHLDPMDEVPDAKEDDEDIENECGQDGEDDPDAELNEEAPQEDGESTDEGEPADEE